MITLTLLFHFLCFSVTRYPIYHLSYTLVNDVVWRGGMHTLWDMKGEKYFLLFEHSELDGKYSLFGSVHVVCM